MFRAMGTFLHDVEIDWGWPFLSDEERAIVRRHEARLQSDRKSYTVETAMLVLAGAALDLPGRLLRARAIDDDHSYYWQIVEGEIYEGHEFDEGGMFPEELTAEDFHAAGVTIVLTPVAIPDATLSELVQDAWQAASDELPAGFRTPPGPRHMHSIYLPVEMWADLKDRAKVEERTISYLVQRAVTAAYALPVA
jgi:hypothetical protein